MSQDYISRTPRSRELFEKAKQVYPGGITYIIRSLPPYPFYVDRARGNRLYDVDGNEYTDYWVGHGALILGHCHPPIVRAIQEQAEAGAHMGYSHPWEVGHARQIVKMVPGVDMVRLTNSGTEANVFAARLARAYTGRNRIAKFEGGWHGSYDALHTGVSWPLEQPDSAGITRGAQQDTLVLPFNDLETAQRRLRDTPVAAVVVEPVQGGAGCIPSSAGFLSGLRQVCDETGALLIFDEVITGFGRTGRWFAVEHWDTVPDIMAIAKGISSAYWPMAATVVTKQVAGAFDEPGQAFDHSPTSAGHPVSAAVALANIDILENESFIDRSAEAGTYLLQRLREIQADHPIVGDVRGLGLLAAVDLVRDRETKERFPKDFELDERLARKFRQRGLILHPRGAIWLTPPLCVTHDEIDRIVDAIDEAVGEVEAEASLVT